MHLPSHFSFDRLCASLLLSRPTLMLQFLLRKEEEIRTRIHSIRLPIRDWRTRWAVTALYFCAPIVGGWLAMPLIVPDPEAMREKLTARLTEEDIARIAEEKRRLQEEFNTARARATRREEQPAPVHCGAVRSST